MKIQVFCFCISKCLSPAPSPLSCVGGGSHGGSPPLKALRDSGGSCPSNPSAGQWALKTPWYLLSVTSSQHQPMPRTLQTLTHGPVFDRAYKAKNIWMGYTRGERWRIRRPSYKKQKCGVLWFGCKCLWYPTDSTIWELTMVEACLRPRTLAIELGLKAL